MGKSIEEWETYFDQISSDFLNEIINALETLQKAEMFFLEYESTHLFTLLRIAKEVKRQRLEAWSRELEEKTQKQYIVTFWDGTVRNASTREEAVTIIKEEMKQWMQKGDVLIWVQEYSDELPSHAQVLNKLREETDATATIKEVGE